MRADGQWRLSTPLDGLATSTSGGTYTAAGPQVSFREARTSITHCHPSQVGTYAFTFSLDCATLRLAFIDDPCTDRSLAFASQPLLRQ